jgi:hypothetical protein
MKKNRKVSTCDRLVLESWGSRGTMSQNLPGHWAGWRLDFINIFGPIVKWWRQLSHCKMTMSDLGLNVILVKRIPFFMDWWWRCLLFNGSVHAAHVESSSQGNRQLDLFKPAQRFGSNFLSRGCHVGWVSVRHNLRIKPLGCIWWPWVILLAQFLVFKIAHNLAISIKWAQVTPFTTITVPHYIIDIP